ncbi:cyanophycinase [Hymenobacter negativus]|uniref:Cyanophycinase n=1 Tax=Hymenobacter negativus TaxID=2795026 RepID=A0ABS0Q426_9BACT|nr:MULTISPECIES: cyanophycinase [Bacteria]MBH8557393.1 cyanophycinase [Hymenobacter negativus]MBH8568067.1 cyanophycinase [Hymenobacter negativus]MBR7207801.1 cyanophycinase [Microvirga sp. STS02]
MPNLFPTPKGKLLLIGGHEQREKAGPSYEQSPEFILKRFVDELPKKGTILVIPTASEEPEESAKEYVDLFKDLGLKHVEVLDVQSREQANSVEALDMLNRADGVMFTGGDQLRLTALLGGTLVLERLTERYLREPIVIAGTSAGATAMSTPMIYQGRNDAGFVKDEIHITTGLQLLRDVAVDTHFIARGRIVRMAQIIATNPGCIGLGLEEDTAVLVSKGNQLEVVGRGIVVLLDGHECTENTIYTVKPGEVFSIRDLRLHLLAEGQRFTLPGFASDKPPVQKPE